MTTVKVAEQFFSVQGGFTTLPGVASVMSKNTYQCHRDGCDGSTKYWPSEREERKRVFCSKECKYEWQSEFNSGSGSPRYNSVELECEVCNESFTRWPSQVEKYDRHFCSNECKNIGHRGEFAGEDNPAWAGGYEYPYVGETWKEARRKVVERDNDVCQRCGVEAPPDETLDAHHITPIKEFDDPFDSHSVDNLIQLCRSCHMEVERGDAEVKIDE